MGNKPRRWPAQLKDTNFACNHIPLKVKADFLEEGASTIQRLIKGKAWQEKLAFHSPSTAAIRLLALSHLQDGPGK